MVSKSKNTKRKFEVESKEENDIQQICYNQHMPKSVPAWYSFCRSGPKWCLSPKIPKDFEVEKVLNNIT